LGSTKRVRDNRRHLWSGAPNCPVHQRTPSQIRHLRENLEALRYNSPDCPMYTGQCPVPQGRAALELASLGNSLRYNSPDCPVYTGQCPVPQGRAALELASLGNSLRYNSPDCPVYTGLSGEPAEQRLLRANGHLQAHLMRARSTQKSGTHALAHRTLYRHVRCVTGHPGGPRRQSSIGRNPTALVTWLAHRTVPCTIRQSATTKRLVWWLGL
jgi:hypothetical protein